MPKKKIEYTRKQINTKGPVKYGEHLRLTDREGDFMRCNPNVDFSGLKHWQVVDLATGQLHTVAFGSVVWAPVQD